MWFKKRSNPGQKAISQSTNFPYMTFVRTENGTFLIKEKTRVRVTTQRILDSWSVSVVEAEESAVRHYPITGKLGFRDGTLINNLGDGKIYLVSKNERRQITSPDAFEKYGLDQSKMIWVSREEANLQKVGEELN